MQANIIKNIKTMKKIKQCDKCNGTGKYWQDDTHPTQDNSGWRTCDCKEVKNKINEPEEPNIFTGKTEAEKANIFWSHVLPILLKNN